MNNKVLTHVGTLENYNFGRPFQTNVELRESKLYWITRGGTKYRKTDGRMAGATMWTQTTLDVNSVVAKTA